MELVQLTLTDGLAHIALDRPEKRNAIDDAMFARLGDIAERVRDDLSVRAVVLTGNGKSFCAGLDLAVHQTFADEGNAGERPYADPDEPAGAGKRRPGRGQRIVRALRDSPAPVIVAIQGHAIGAGMQIALGADVRIAHPDAKLGCAEMDFGMTVDMGGSQLLPPLVGADRAMDMLLTGRLLTGTVAEAWGLVTRCSDDPVSDALALGSTIASKNPTATRETKRLVRLAETAIVADGMHEELRVLARNVGSPEQVAAVAAYFERRRGR